jgi:hypothetical protein
MQICHGKGSLVFCLRRELLAQLLHPAVRTPKFSKINISISTLKVKAEDLPASPTTIFQCAYRDTVVLSGLHPHNASPVQKLGWEQKWDRHRALGRTPECPGSRHQTPLPLQQSPGVGTSGEMAAACR